MNAKKVQTKIGNDYAKDVKSPIKLSNNKVKRH